MQPFCFVSQWNLDIVVSVIDLWKLQTAFVKVSRLNRVVVTFADLAN